MICFYCTFDNLNNIEENMDFFMFENFINKSHSLNLCEIFIKRFSIAEDALFNNDVK